MNGKQHNDDFGWPGEGAVELGRELVAGLIYEEARLVIRKLLAGELLADDPRIKRCAICGYPFRDKTKPRNATVCGQTCATERDRIRKAQERAEEAKEKPKAKKTKKTKPVSYYWWLEYPFFITEKRMLSRVWSYERPHGNIYDIYAAKTRDEMTGGKRKPKYHADEWD